MTLFGIQLEYMPIIEEDREYNDYIFELKDISWALTDYWFFGKNTFPGDYYTENIDFESFYDKYLDEELSEYVLQEIIQYMNRKDYCNIFNKRITVPVIMNAEWISDVDWESGYDEGQYSYKFENVMDL